LGNAACSGECEKKLQTDEEGTGGIQEPAIEYEESPLDEIRQATVAKHRIQLNVCEICGEPAAVCVDESKIKKKTWLCAKHSVMKFEREAQWKVKTDTGLFAHVVTGVASLLNHAKVWYLKVGRDIATRIVR
jgi:hypothetical protein